MSVRFVIRPQSYRSTPQRIAEELNAEAVHTRETTPSRVDYSYDFILEHSDHPRISTFYNSTKGRQRSLLHSYGLPTPDHTGVRENAQGNNNRWIVRPHRHSGGESYQVFDREPTEAEVGSGYVSKAFPKKYEYRVVFSYGVPIIILGKNRPEGKEWYDSWSGPDGGSFYACDEGRSRIETETNAVTELSSKIPFLSEVPLTGFDILIARDMTWCVCEMNFVPAMEHARGLERLRQNVLQHFPAR